MKKITSLLMAVLMMCTILTTMAIPAFAEDEPTEITVENSEIHAEGNCIISAGVKVVKVLEVKENSTLTIAQGATVAVTGKFINNGTVTVNGTLDILTCKEKTGVENVNVGATGHFDVEKSSDEGYNPEPNPVNKPGYDRNINIPTYMSSTLSEGSMTIIVGIAAAVVFGLGGFFIGKAAGKKKKPTIASGENTDEE